MPSAQPRILLLFEYATLNGGEHSLLAMLQELLQLGYKFIAAAPPEGKLIPKLSNLGIPILPLQLLDATHTKRPPEEINLELKQTIAAAKADVVHANSLSMGRMLGRVAPELSIPTVSHLRDIIKLSRPALRDLNQNSALIAVSKATAKFHVEQGLEQAKLNVVYNGIDQTLFHPREATGWLQRELKLPDGTILIANIGQICLRKGQDVVALATVRLLKELPNLHLLYVGERHSKKEESKLFEENLLHIFQEAGSENHVHFLGYRADVNRILNEVDLLVHCAHQEPLGRVLLEASAAGCPILATNVGGTGEIIDEGVSGQLISPGNEAELTFQMRKLLQTPELKTQMGHAAQEISRERFSLPKAATQLSAIWNRLL